MVELSEEDINRIAEALEKRLEDRLKSLEDRLITELIRKVEELPAAPPPALPGQLTTEAEELLRIEKEILTGKATAKKTFENIREAMNRYQFLTEAEKEVLGNLVKDEWQNIVDSMLEKGILLDPTIRWLKNKIVPRNLERHSLLIKPISDIGATYTFKGKEINTVLVPHYTYIRYFRLQELPNPETRELIMERTERPSIWMEFKYGSIQTEISDVFPRIPSMDWFATRTSQGDAMPILRDIEDRGKLKYWPWEAEFGAQGGGEIQTDLGSVAVEGIFRDWFAVKSAIMAAWKKGKEVIGFKTQPTS